MDAFGAYNLKAKRPFCNAFDGCGGKKRSDPSAAAFLKGSSPEATEALVKALAEGAADADDIAELLMSGGLFDEEAGGDGNALFYGSRVRRDAEEAPEVTSSAEKEE